MDLNQEPARPGPALNHSFSESQKTGGVAARLHAPEIKCKNDTRLQCILLYKLLIIFVVLIFAFLAFQEFD